MSNASSPSSSTAPSPASVLCVYAEPLVRGRRVALVGVDDGALAELLVSLGARVLHVYDPRPAEQLPKGEGRATVVPFRAGDLGVRDGAFDIALVPDLALLGQPEAALAQVRRLVGATGAALIACRNAEAAPAWSAAPESPTPPAYAEFFDLCSLQFADVRMLGVAPFAAYAVAAFAPEREPNIVFDATLASTPEPPEWFVAVAAQRPASALEAYEIVQIPRANVDVAEVLPKTIAKADLASIELKLREAEARAGDQYVRAERLGNDLRAAGEEARKLRERTQKLAKEIEDERKVRAKLEEELAIARKGAETTKLRERVGALEAELIEARTALASPRPAPVELGKLQSERDALTQDVASLQRQLQQAQLARDDARHRMQDRERELDAALARGKSLEDRIEELQASRGLRDEERQAVEERLAAAADQTLAQARVIEALREELAALAATHENDVQSLEASLRRAGEELRSARVELAHRERMVRELVARLEDASAAPVAVPVPVAHVDSALADELRRARHELAELVARVRKSDAEVDALRLAVAARDQKLVEEHARIDALAREAARREAALQTASWKLAEMEALGSQAQPAGANAQEPTTDVALRNERDALRRALEQEHERREALEARLLGARGGDADELARARASLQEHEALIAQLAAQLASRQ